jgi:hypothetical protein
MALAVAFVALSAGSAEAVITNGLIGYWPHVGPTGVWVDQPLYSAVDEAGTIGTLLTRRTPGPGLLPDGSGVSAVGGFDLKSDNTYLGTADGPVFPGRAPFSVALWVRALDLDSAGRRVVSREESTSGGAQGWLIYMSNSKLAFQRRSDSHIDEAAATGLTPQTHRTYYVVATYDGTTMRLYVDGQLRGTRTSTLNLQPASGPTHALNFGAYDPARGPTRNASSILFGQFASPAIYDRALSAAEVQSEFDAEPPGYAGTIAADSPAGYWPLRDVDATAAPEIAGGNGFRVQSLGPALLPNGTGSSAVSIEDDHAAIRFPGGFDFAGTAPFSAEVWVRAHDLDSKARRIMSEESLNGGGTQGWLVYMSSTRLGFQRRADGVTDEAASGSFVPQTHRTYHVVATYDGSTMRLYVNGALVATKASAMAMKSSTTPFVIGAYQGDPGHPDTVWNEFEGQFAAPAMYDHALSAARVLAHYDAGSQGYESALLARDPVGYWPLHDYDSYATDESGHGADGTLNGFATPDAGIRRDGTGEAVFANGVAKVMTLGPTFGFAGRQPFSVDLWFRAGQLDGTARRIASTEHVDAGQISGWVLYVTSGKIALKRRSPSGSSEVISTGVTPQVGRRYHVLATYDGADLRMYVDDTLRATTPSLEDVPVSSTPLVIGAYESGGSSSLQFVGDIQDVAIFDRAVTPFSAPS